MRTIDEYLSIKTCDCGRKDCLFFSGLIDDFGCSFSEADIKYEIKCLEQFVKKSNDAIKHLKKLLKKPSKVQL
jgi:hypothetical protein